MAIMSDLIKNSLPTTFSKGQELYKKGKIKFDDFLVVEDDSIIKYYSKYQGTMDIYRQSLFVSDDEIVELNCTCPAFFQYGGYCKHCVAVGFAVINQNNKKEIIDNSFEKLLSKEEYTNAFLIPYFYFESGMIILELKINIGKEYVIRNIDDFISSIRYGYEMKLGSSSYIPNIEYFDEKSKKLIFLLMNLMNLQKRIVLSDVLFDNIFEIYRGSNMNFSFNRKRKHVFENEEYDLVVTLEDDKLKIDPNLSIITGFLNNYVSIDNSLFRIKKINEKTKPLYNQLFSKRSISIKGYEKKFAKRFYNKMDNVIVPEDFKIKYSEDNILIDTYLDYDGVIKLERKVYVNGVLESNYYDIDDDTLQDYERYVESLNFYNNEISDIFDMVEFINTDISKFRDFGILYISDRLNNLTIKTPKQSNISIRYELDLLEINVENDDLTEEEITKILQAYKKKKKYIKLKGNIIDVSSFKDADILNDLNIEKNVLGTHKIESYNIFKLAKYFDSSKAVDIINKFNNLDKLEYELNPTLNGKLKDYQKIGFNWLNLLKENKFGGILADDMGLGKTLQIISLIESEKTEKPSIIVCPMSLIYNWHNEFIKWGFTNSIVISGNAIERENIIKSIKKDYIYIISYDSLRRDIELINNDFRFIVADEAQFIKNNQTLKSKAIKKLNGDIKYALTGTPIENKLSDLWSIFDFILPNYLGDNKTFRETYEVPIFQNDKETLNILIKKITPFVLRRCKKDVLKELPPRIDEVMYVNMDNEHRKLYDSYFLDAKRKIQSAESKIEILSLLTRLRQICVEPKMFLDNYDGTSSKLEMSLNIIEESIANGHKILLFSQFTSAFQFLAKRLDDLNIKYYVITGATKAKDRLNLVDSFNSDDSIKVFLISLKAGGTGLNLIGADVVIHYDPWWNVAAENQATDRTHRIGQLRSVTVIKLICNNTIEQKVLELQNLKKNLSDSIINDEESIKLTNNDIKYLLE